MSTRTKVFHLEIDGEHHYFGSPKAMFDVMGPERMGMQYRSYHSNIVLKVGDVYKNRRKGYIIRVGMLQQAKTNRGQDMEARINQRAEELIAQRQLENQTAQNGANIPEAIPTAAPIPEQTAPAAQPTVQTEAPAQRKPRKKKGDVPEQLTLF